MFGSGDGAELLDNRVDRTGCGPCLAALRGNRRL